VHLVLAPPEQLARQQIDRLLTQAGWSVQDFKAVDLHAARGVVIRELPLDACHGFADYLLDVDGKACGVIEAKKLGATLTGVEVEPARYAQGLPASLPAWRRPLPVVYESTGAETHFSNGLDPEPRAQRLCLPPAGDAGQMAAAGRGGPGCGADHGVEHGDHAATHRSAAPRSDHAGPAPGYAAAGDRMGRAQALAGADRNWHP
jgi:hypothetical protein